MAYVTDMLQEPRRIYLRGVVSIERVISRALQVGRHGTTKQDAVHLVVDVARPVPEVERVRGQPQGSIYSLVKCQQDEGPRGVEVRVCEQGYEPVVQPRVGI